MVSCATSARPVSSPHPCSPPAPRSPCTPTCRRTRPPRPSRSAGRSRYLTAVSTDKPVYRPGETVYVRGVLLHAFDHTPLGEAARRPSRSTGPRARRSPPARRGSAGQRLGLLLGGPGGAGRRRVHPQGDLSLERPRPGRAQVRRPRLPRPAPEDADRLPPRRLRPRRHGHRHARGDARRGRHARRREGDRHRARRRRRGRARPGTRRTSGARARSASSCRRRSPAARARSPSPSRTAAWSRPRPRRSRSCCRRSISSLLPRGRRPGRRRRQPRLLRGAHAGEEAGRPGRRGRRRPGARWSRASAPSTRAAAASSFTPAKGGAVHAAHRPAVGHQDDLPAAGGRRRAGSRCARAQERHRRRARPVELTVAQRRARGKVTRDARASARWSCRPRR